MRSPGKTLNPLPTHSKLAARLQEPVDDKQPKHLLPTHRPGACQNESNPD